MDSLPSEMIREIFKKMDVRTANTFRSSSRYCNWVFERNRRAMPKVEFDLFIYTTDELIYVISMQQKCPRLKLMINPEGPDDEAIDRFDLREIVGKNGQQIEEIVYETANLVRSLERIFRNMELYCQFNIITENETWPNRCSYCLIWLTSKVDEVGRRRCQLCIEDFEIFKTFSLRGRFPNVFHTICSYISELRRTSSPVSWSMEEVVEKLSVAYPKLEYPFSPIFIKYPSKNREDIREFINGLTGVVQELKDHSTGIEIIDGHSPRVVVWMPPVNRTVIVLGHDDVIVFHRNHFNRL